MEYLFCNVFRWLLSLVTRNPTTVPDEIYTSIAEAFEQVFSAYDRLFSEVEAHWKLGVVLCKRWVQAIGCCTAATAASLCEEAERNPVAHNDVGVLFLAAMRAWEAKNST